MASPTGDSTSFPASSAARASAARSVTALQRAASGVSTLTGRYRKPSRNRLSSSIKHRVEIDSRRLWSASVTSATS